MSISAINTFLKVGGPDITEAEIRAVSEVLRSGWLGYGKVAQQFEREFAEFLGVEYAVAVSSCTVGLFLALKAAGVGKDDEVATTPLTFAATVNAILATGAKPVFLDHGVPFTEKMKVQAYVPVHLWGEPYPVSRMQGIKVIEDAAHGFGGSYYGLPLGTIGDFGVFSFYPTKNITSGDGGMVVCKTKEDADKVRELASQGLNREAWQRYSEGPINECRVLSVGFKGLLSDVSASIGLSQLRRWPELRERRNIVFKTYEEELGKKKFGHSQHIYEIRVKNRDMMRRKLHHLGIGTGVHYTPLHLEPAYKFLGYKEGDFPVAEEIGRETLSLPVSSTMTTEDAKRVIDAVNRLDH
jgi:dTDP-4-amino-4,6-dideoxygalactose transaminase